MNLLLETQNLTKYYGRHLALDGLSISLGEGEIVGFLGPNGAGKTTALRVVLGLLKASSGDVRLFGRRAKEHGPGVRNEIGYLPGDLRLYPRLSAEVALGMFGRIRGRDLRSVGLSLAERLGLDPTLPAGRMSRGTRQKLGLVLALAHSPRLLILDEPTSGLDPLVQEALKALLRERADAGATVLFSSHTLSEVERVCERVVILKEGRTVAESTIEELRTRARREAVVTWRGESTADDDSLPPSVEVTSRRESVWRLAFHGDASALLEWIRSVDRGAIGDVSISPPDLETVFQEYYR